ncbi:MAG: M56 family metallopeptidase, partial [Oscillospiraceae bacterium]|nr:M56 family metallopeptidase [Oscillospiraceae bacterium]
GGAVILLILPLRLLLRRAPKRFSYLLWAAAAFRLCVPASLPTPFSLFRLLSGTPAAPSAPGPLDLPFPVEAAPAAAEAAVSAGVQAAAAQSSPAVSAAAGASAFPWLRLLALVWLAGVAVLLLYGLIGDLRLRRRLRTAIRQEDGSWRASGITTPFLLGLLRPRIYLPWGLEGTDRDLALEHEKAHLRRFDPWWRLLGWLLLCLHWFNPLCWLAFLLAGRDMELSCDEAVLSRRGKAGEYSESLLRIAEKGRPLSPLPLAFGELGVRQRVKNALRWKPARGWASAMLALLCLLFFAACATDPKVLTPAKTELTLNADGTVGPFRWAMTPEEAAEAWPGLSIYENKKHSSAYAELPDVSFCGHPAEVTLCFPKHAMKNNRQHWDENGYPVLESIQIVLQGEIDLTEELTAILGERETRKVDDHLGPEHEYVDGKPRPCYYEQELPEKDWYWHSESVLSDLATVEQLKLMTPLWRNEPDQKIMELWCSLFNWEVHIYDEDYYYRDPTEEEPVTVIACEAYGYARERFIEYLEKEKEAGA